MNVAPPAGAWIETHYGLLLTMVGWVAPPAGAWIETSSLAGKANTSNSRTSRRCVD